MRLIGLTGGIASGKSTVSGMLEALGVRVIDTDKLARAVVAPGQPAQREIMAWLGPAFACPDGSLDRRKIADLVFNDSEARAALEAIIHPRIAAAVERETAAAEAAGLPAVVLDVPLLFETGWDKRVDEVWVVFANEGQQLERLRSRDGFDEAQAKARLGSQLSMTEKVRQADLVIDNSKDREATEAAVRAAWQRVLAAGS